jgi:aspartate kinase
VKTVVQKYGGSSVADPHKLGLVADRVAAAARDGQSVVVVVSAMGKTTDQLLELARSVAEEPPRRELDMLLSTGERISMALLAMALEARGLPAISFTGSQSGILTNDRHSGARIIEVRPVRIEDELARGKVVIVAGFQGMSYKREITTLGRGGSDTTAVALAAALGASCEIYSDVDGVYTADPRVVPDAHRLDEIGYEEMQELAEHGAKVLNAQAVAWAARAGILIHARATSGSTAETKIGPFAAQSTRVVVTATRSLSVVDGPVRAILEILAAERVGLRSVDGDSVAFGREDIPDWPRVERRLRESGARIGDFAEVTLVGGGIGSDAARIREAMIAVEEAGGQVTKVAASPLRLTLRLASAEPLNTVVAALHARFA